MENIQERALRFVYDDFISSYEELLNKINLPTLRIGRMRIMAIEVFKILLGLCPPVLSNLVQKKGKFIYNFRCSNILQVPTVRTSMPVKSITRYAAPVLWNSLPDDFRKYSNFNQFKSLILSWNGKNIIVLLVKRSENPWHRSILLICLFICNLCF